MLVTTTPRLRLRWLEASDAAFILELVNDPDWHRHIGDRGVRTLDDALAYIAEGPRAMYSRLGHGLYAIDLLRGGATIGLCGLIRRDTLPEVDIGYALLPQFRGHGYALEAAQATLRVARGQFGLRRLLAITSPGNAASERLLGKLGLRFERTAELVPGGPALRVFGATLSAEDTPAA